MDSRVPQGRRALLPFEIVIEPSYGHACSIGGCAPAAGARTLTRGDHGDATVPDGVPRGSGDAGALLLGLGAVSASAQSFQTAAPHAILVDSESGSVLFEKAADEPFSPASMAKLMTAEIVFGALKEGRLTMDTEFTVTEDAWRRGGAGGGGSSMFAQVNSRIKLSDLLRGLVVQSGNDAAIPSPRTWPAPRRPSPAS